MLVNLGRRRCAGGLRKQRRQPAAKGGVEVATSYVVKGVVGEGGGGDKESSAKSDGEGRWLIGHARGLRFGTDDRGLGRAATTRGALSGGLWSALNRVAMDTRRTVTLLNLIHEVNLVKSRHK